MSGRNWAQARSREQMRRQGVDNIADMSVPRLPGSKPPKPRKSKADLRAELEAAMAEHRKLEQRIFDAAKWYVQNRATCPHPVVPELRRRFDLSPAQAIEAIQHANAAQCRGD